ncbi:MAG: tetratricopeptide repeat protein [Phycisphaerales bacterium]
MPLTPLQIAEHNRHYEAGWKLLYPYLILHGRRQIVPGWFGRWRLKRAAQHFRSALALAPDSWPAMWGLGKLHQRLEEHADALRWLRQAVQINPDHPDVLREAGIEASEVGDHRYAAEVFARAIAVDPEDPGHHANLAVALLNCGSVLEAEKSISRALALAPDDSISQAVAERIRVAGQVVASEADRAIPREQAPPNPGPQ